MAEITEIVQVNVTLGTRPIDTASFSIPMLMSVHNVFTERSRIYSSVTAAVADGFDTEHPVVKYLTGCFSGVQPPTQVIVGRKLLQDVIVTPTTVADNTTYTLKLKVGTTVTTISVDSGVAATAATIATQIYDAIEPGVIAGVSATDNTGSVTIAPDVITTAFAIYSVSSNLTVTYTADAGEDFTTAYTAIKADTSTDWFFISADSHLTADILEVAGIAEANSDFYVTSSSEADIKNASLSTDIASQLQTLQYQNTNITYHEDADTVFPEGAVIGSWAATNPGTTTLHGRSLVGVAISDLSDSEIAAIAGKNANSYVQIAGSGFYLDGFVPDGNFSDTIRFKLWLEARVAESVFGLIKRKSDQGLKVPYNAVGFAMVRQAITEVLDLAYARGATTLFDTGEKYIVTIPERTAIATNDRAARLLPDVNFEVIYSSAIHRVITIQGYVSV